MLKKRAKIFLDLTPANLGSYMKFKTKTWIVWTDGLDLRIDNFVYLIT